MALVRLHLARSKIECRDMNILSIQSWVSYGHVGNASAVFPLQRLGAEVWSINTVQFSNHTGYGAWTGEVFAAAHVAAVVRGIADRGVLTACDGVLSGYVGAVATGEAILAAVARVKAGNPKACYCCDPVIGSRSRGSFVREGVAAFMRDGAVPAADLLTPNHFELDVLTGCTTATHADVLAAIAGLRARGPRVVLVKSVRAAETPRGMIDVIAADASGAYMVRTPHLPVAANGAGDLMAALFLFHYLDSGAVATTLAKATSSVFGILRRTLEGGAAEMSLIAAQDELVTPSEAFVPQALEL
jgi:pyridoxine kinase